MPDPNMIFGLTIAILAISAVLAGAAVVVARSARAHVDILVATNRAMCAELQAARDEARKGAEREHRLWRELAAAKDTGTGSDAVRHLIALVERIVSSAESPPAPALLAAAAATAPPVAPLDTYRPRMIGGDS